MDLHNAYWDGKHYCVRIDLHGFGVDVARADMERANSFYRCRNFAVSASITDQHDAQMDVGVHRRHNWERVNSFPPFSTVPL